MANIPFVELERVFRQAGQLRAESGAFDSILKLTVVRVLREYACGSDSEEHGHRLLSFGGLLSFTDGNSEFGVCEGIQNEGTFCVELFCFMVSTYHIILVVERTFSASSSSLIF